MQGRKYVFSCNCCKDENSKIIRTFHSGFPKCFFDCWLLFYTQSVRPVSLLQSAIFFGRGDILLGRYQDRCLIWLQLVIGLLTHLKKQLLNSANKLGKLTSTEINTGDCFYSFIIIHSHYINIYQRLHMYLFHVGLKNPPAQASRKCL